MAVVFINNWMQKEDTILYIIPEMCDLIAYKESGPSCFSSSPGPVKEVEVHVVASVHNTSIGNTAMQQKPPM